MKTLSLCGAAMAAGLVVCAPARAAGEPADLILVGAAVYTMDDTRPEATAVAVTSGTVVRTGTREAVLQLRGPGTRVIELPEGACVLPGLVDAHAHLESLGKSLLTVSLLGTSSAAECAQRVRERAAGTPPGEWIEGRGWDHTDWSPEEFPSWRDLEDVGTHPVVLRRVDGHAAWLNRAALVAAGITRDTPDPDGGRIVRDGDGRPTGVLVDNAMDLVSSHIPAPTPDQLDRRMRAAVEHCIRLGLTGMHDAGSTAADLASLERLAERGELDLRVYSMLSADDPGLLARWFERGPGTLAGGRVEVRAVKLYADGALGSRGAALLQPYSDDPDNRGLVVTSRGELEDICGRAVEAGFQVCVHAIGDRGNRMALDVYEDVLKSHGGPDDRRLRIEHCQVVAEGDFRRFADLGVIASMQPTHATSDMNWAQARVGPERIGGAYAWRRFLDLGVPLPLGSDFPVESANPLWGIYAAVTRQDHRGEPAGGWYPDQSLTVEEAVFGFTAATAYAAFAEDSRGRLSPGYAADITVLDHDILHGDPAAMLRTRVLYTIVDGSVVYDAASH